MKKKVIKMKPEASRSRCKCGSWYTSYEDMTGKTFEIPVKKAA